MLKCFAFTLLVIFIVKNFANVGGLKMRFRRFDCKSSNKTIPMSTMKCYTKSYSRDFTTGNVYVNATRPLFDVKVGWCFKEIFFLKTKLFKVHFDANIRVNAISPFYNNLINYTINACQFLNGSDSNNPILRWLIEMVQQSLPTGFLHSCPYFGIVQAYNVTVVPVERLIIQFPKGYYRTISRAFDDMDDNILTGVADIELL